MAGSGRAIPTLNSPCWAFLALTGGPGDVGTCPHPATLEGVEWAEPPGEIWGNGQVTVAPSAIEGHGPFALDDLATGTLVIRLAGRLVSSEELMEILADSGADDSAPYVDTITVDEDRHLVLPPVTTVHFGNHSCDPNMWHAGPYEIVTRWPIGVGEELTYATQTEGFSMTCRCGSSRCRGEVSGSDWRRPDLQDRYRGHWVPALENRIRSS